MFIKSIGHYVSDNIDEITIFIRGILSTSKYLEFYMTAENIVDKRVQTNIDFNSGFNDTMKMYGFEKFYAISETDVKYITELCKVTAGYE